MTEPTYRISRRKMLSQTAGTTAGLAFVSQWPKAAQAANVLQANNNEVWDMHGHLNGLGENLRGRVDTLLKHADRVGIKRLIVFMGTPFSIDPSPDEVRRQNDQVLQAIRYGQGRLFGFVYLNPKHVEASLDELNRCVAEGPMVGIKLWVALRCHDAKLDPLVRRAIELQAVILQHAWYKTTGNLPGESTPADVVTLAARHPKATFIAAHVGGNWELGIRTIRATPNIIAGISGFDPTAGVVEMAVRELGAERVMYGSDRAGRSYASQLAKVYSADIPEAAKRLILGGNIRCVLAPLCKAKGIAL